MNSLRHVLLWRVITLPEARDENPSRVKVPLPPWGYDTCPDTGFSGLKSRLFLVWVTCKNSATLGWLFNLCTYRLHSLKMRIIIAVLKSVSQQAASECSRILPVITVCSVWPKVMPLPGSLGPHVPFYSLRPSVIQDCLRP